MKKREVTDMAEKKFENNEARALAMEELGSVAGGRSIRDSERRTWVRTREAVDRRIEVLRRNPYTKYEADALEKQLMDAYDEWIFAIKASSPSDGDIPFYAFFPWDTD